MMTVFNFNFDNPIHNEVFKQMTALAVQYGVPMQTMVGSNVSTTVSESMIQSASPTPESKIQKTYAPATDVQCKWVQDKNRVSYTLADGKYVGQTGARKTLKARLRAAGAEYDASTKSWKFTTSKKAADFVANTSALVTAADIENVRAKAQARAEKKANKSA